MKINCLLSDKSLNRITINSRLANSMLKSFRSLMDLVSMKVDIVKIIIIIKLIRDFGNNRKALRSIKIMIREPKIWMFQREENLLSSHLRFQIYRWNSTLTLKMGASLWGPYSLRTDYKDKAIEWIRDKKLYQIRDSNKILSICILPYQLIQTKIVKEQI